MVLDMKIKLWIIIMILGFLLIGGGFFYYRQQVDEEREMSLERANRLLEEADLLEEINANYGEIVKLTVGSNIYKKDLAGNFVIVGKALNEVTLELSVVEKLTINDKYFNILDTPYYVYYQDVVPSSLELDKRYLNYVPFSLVIELDSDTVYYDSNYNELFTLKDTLTKTVIEIDDDYYGIDLFSKLVYVRKEEAVRTVDLLENDSLLAALEVPAILYHFIYLNGDTSCNEIICHSEEQIDSHFKFLVDNNVFTLNTSEVLKFIKGEINLPKKSILITIDDGARAENFIPFLEKYQLNATLFLVSSWYPVSKFTSPYLEIASHTHNMHTTGVCPTGQGGGINCLKESEILNDLKLSRETLNNTEAFCFPFYEYSDYSINLVKEAGFEMAFIGGSTKIKKGIDPYKIPRYPILSSFGVDYISNLVLG